MIFKVAKSSIVLISPQELNVKLKQEKLTLIDVRERSEYDQGHLNNSLLMPLSELNESDFNKLIKWDNLVIYCRSGKRSHNVAEKLINLGKSLVYDLEGGILAWESAHLPIEFNT